MGHSPLLYLSLQKETELRKFRRVIKPPVSTILALVFIFGIALGLRTYLTHDIVFTGDWVKFQGMDAWYHMRLVDNLVHHFPHRINFDPYAIYPGGQNLAIGPFFDLLLGFFILLIEPHSPSKQFINAAGAYYPAILGALVTIPVYFIGRELFSEKAGLLSAGLVAILPGALVSYSLLGSTDHHVAETLLSAATMLFLMLGVNRAVREDLCFRSLGSGNWRTVRRPLLYSLLGGLALGCYLLTWVRGAFLVFLILGWLAVQYIVEHTKSRSPDYLCILGVPCLLIALLMILPFLGSVLYMESQAESLVGGLLALPVLSGLSFAMYRKKIKPGYYPLAVMVLIGLAFGGLHLIAPLMVRWFVAESRRFLPQGTALTVAEARPLLFMTGSFSLAPIWLRFTTSFFLALVSLPILAYRTVKDGRADKTLLLVWSVVMLMATLGQNRFTYYFVVNAAILTAFLCSKVLEWGGFRKVVEKPSAHGENQKDAKDPRLSRLSSARATRMLAMGAVFFWVFYPNIGLAIRSARDDLGPDQDWYDALGWMKGNTPEPFKDPNFYYALYAKPATGEDYRYPESAYGVMSWWDYGYWIVNIAHRIPNANPSQLGAREAALFFTAQDEMSANEWLDKLGSRYVIVDGQLPVWHIPGSKIAAGKFPAIAMWADKSLAQFFEEYYQRTPDGNLVPVFLYYPEYYRTMLCRLYLFEGKAIAPQNSTWVISYTEKTRKAGDKYKELSSIRRFATYEEAKTFLETQTAPNFRLVGMNPLMSCVPFEELKQYKLVYTSPTTKFSASKKPAPVFSSLREISNVEVFEYLKP